VQQLRQYVVKPGQMEPFLEVFRQLRPIRARHGFRVVGSWTAPAENEFVWIVEHDGDFAAAEEAYYGDPARNAIKPAPGEFLDTVTLRMIEPVS